MPMTERNPLADDWQRIVAWIEAHAPELLDDLDEPADRADIAAAEAELGIRFPRVLRQFYALQNGTIDFGVFPALEPGEPPFGPLAVDEIELAQEDDDEDESDETEEDFDVDPQVKPEYWNLRWIPFAGNGEYDYLMIDMDPARGGMPGQVIEWRHKDLVRRVVARSLEAFLREIADGLDAGRIRYDGSNGLRRTP